MTTIGERIVLAEAGFEKPLVHEVSESELAAPLPGGIVVRVEACGICGRDLIDRAGRFPFMRFPIVPGHEAVGTVVAAGAEVTDFKVGDRVGTMHRDSCGDCPACEAGETSLCRGPAAWVFGILADGGYATHTSGLEKAFYPVPKGIDAPTAAVMHCTLGTAYRDLVTFGHLSKGERVLITGANGGVGIAAVQIAARLGAEVTAVVRSERHSEHLRALGADHVVVDVGNKFHERANGFDLAVDAVGFSTFGSTLRSLRIGGRVVVVGNIVAERVALNLGYVITQGLTIIGGSGATRREMAAIAELHAARPVEGLVDRTMPLARAEEAQRLVREGGLSGRIVLLPS